MDRQGSEALAREHASPASFERGVAYHRGGAVHLIARSDTRIDASVEGSEGPYSVHVSFGPGRRVTGVCSCPYDRGDWCKHIVASILEAADPAGEREPALAELAEALDAEQLRRVIVAAAARNAEAAEALEAELLVATASTTKTPAPDTAAIRRAVRSSLRSLDRMRPSQAYWHVGSVVDEIRTFLGEAIAHLEAGNAPWALSTLDAVTDAYLDGWEGLDDSDGEASGFIDELGQTWIDVGLSVVLAPPERARLVQKLDRWAAAVGDYWDADAFHAAARALRAGWDDPDLVAVLSGTEPSPLAARKVADEGPDLIDARLRILRLQGRWDEYLRLASATGHAGAAAEALVLLGRFQDAAEFALANLAEASVALTIARLLEKRGATAEALKVAEHGLGLAGFKIDLAAWLREVAAANGLPALALKAARVVFEEAPGTETYAGVRALAGDDWPAVRAELLASLRGANPYPYRGGIEVFLEEGLIDDAIAAAARADYETKERVVVAALDSRPEWAIETSLGQAEYIMAGGHSSVYYRAGEWLRYAARAYRATGRESEWQAYIADALARHRRKYKLRPLLDRLARERG